MDAIQTLITEDGGDEGAAVRCRRAKALAMASSRASASAMVVASTMASAMASAIASTMASSRKVVMASAMAVAARMASAVAVAARMAPRMALFRKAARAALVQEGRHRWRGLRDRRSRVLFPYLLASVTQ